MPGLYGSSCPSGRALTRQLRAGFVFLSGILYEPPEQFWELPATWRPAHRLLEAKAREAGLGILTDEERRENWRTAVLRLKGVIEPHGIAFPGIPEIGVDGETVAFDPNDIIRCSDPDCARLAPARLS